MRHAIRWGSSYADGFIAATCTGDAAPALCAYSAAEEAWKAQGRDCRPRFVGGVYFAMGPNPVDRVTSYLKNWNPLMGSNAEIFANAIPSSPEAVLESIRAFADIGMDELVLWPCIPEMDQVDWLADLVALAQPDSG